MFSRDSLAPLDLRYRRFAAFLIDALFVVALGALVGELFRPLLIPMGRNAQWVGFAMALAYHGGLNSHIFGGATLGKRLVRLEVRSSTSSPLGVGRSLLRSLLIINWFFDLQEIPLDGILPEGVSYILTGVCLSFFLSMVSAAAESPGRRSAHEYIFGTAVVEKEATDPPLGRFPKRIVILVSAISVAICTFFFGMHLLQPVDPEFLTDLDQAHKNILAMPGIRDASVRIEDKSVQITLSTTSDKFSESTQLGARCVVLLSKRLKTEDPSTTFTVSVAQGFDMGIYRSWEVRRMSYPLTDWISISTLDLR